MNRTYFGCMCNLSAFITRSVYWFFLPISFSPNIILIPWLKSKVDFKPPPLFFRTHLAISQKQWAADRTHLLLMILPPHLPVLPSPDHIYGTIVSYLTFFKRTYKLPTYNRSILCAKSYRSEYLTKGNIISWQDICRPNRPKILPFAQYSLVHDLVLNHSNVIFGPKIKAVRTWEL